MLYQVKDRSKGQIVYDSSSRKCIGKSKLPLESVLMVVHACNPRTKEPGLQT